VPDALLDDAVVRVQAEAPEAPRDLVGALVRSYLDAAELHDLAVFSPQDVAGAVLTHLRIVGTRSPGDAIVSVENPSREHDGWESPHTLVEIVTDDMPFLVDSVSAAIVGRGYDIHLLFHPLFGGESHLHVEIDRETDRALLDSLRDELVAVIADVGAVVRDWQPMRDRVLARAAELRRAPPPTAESGDVVEAATFLEWLADDHFTFIGASAYDVVDTDGGAARRLVPGSELGFLRDRPPSEPSDGSAGAAFVLTLTKARECSTVHRVARLDSVGVKRFDPAGTVVGEDRFLGLYTANVYSQSATTVPILRRKTAQVMARAGLPPKGHDGRALAHILETFPRDELFRLSVDELFAIAMGILGMGARRRVRLFVSRDDLGAFVSCLVYLPRDRYTTPVRIKIVEALRRAFDGAEVDYTVLVSDDVMARLHVVVTTPGARPAGSGVDLALEAELSTLARTWGDDFRDALVGAHGEEVGLDMFRTWADAFPLSYQLDVSAADAVGDLAVLTNLDPGGDLELRIQQPASRDDIVRAKLYRSGSALVLSDVMPLLEHLGVTVVDERPYAVTVPRDDTRWVYAFGIRADAGDALFGPVVQARVRELFLGVFAGEIENDGLNRLVLRCELTARDIVILRALCKYLRQAGLRFTDAYLADTLTGNRAATRLVVELFHARLDPDRVRDDANVERVVGDLTAAIEAVTSLDADRILRSLMHVVLATVRTNAYQRAARAGSAGDGNAPTVTKAYVAVKLDPASLDFLPAPLPRHEIWVYAPHVEAVHLRAGDIARGGIRWSDRREDFRTEILGLMKAQTAKNSVIVPVGAKGGFVVKQPFTAVATRPSPDAVLAAYQTFIRGLLDLTDNVVDGAVVGPERVLRHDGDDPYLVVAADKGTATFSDVANALAAEYGYWLGDAFASGGSAGFDHKAMGITSRGAWMSVRAHFRSLGIDADTASLTVVGIGDMSGDVFGNGLLRSRHVRLVAAFDHRHVFVDPDPDPERSYEERARLFQLPGSSWSDYDPGLLSPGGGVFSRTAKSVTLSPQGREVLGVAQATLTPDELVSAVLRAPADLLWNGGVGTFVKASTESHLDVADRANDAVRVDAGELRCRVVAEGGNLGFTQRGRVEFALTGGRINTDAIDNSAGVDASDHEVNIKILLQRAIAQGALAAGPERDALLERMTDDVARLVLAHNEGQANALEIASVEAAALIGVHARQMERLEQGGHLDRALEGMPTPKAIQERHAAGLGLTAPELAVLLAATKLELERELVTSDVPDDAYLHTELVAYFPTILRDDLRDAIGTHPLRRQIVATVVANAVVDRAGISFLSRLSDETGFGLPTLTRAHLIARDVFAAATTWSAIDALDLQVPAAIQDDMFLSVRRLVERAARWLVHHETDLMLGPTVERYAATVQAITAALPDLLVGVAADELLADADRLRASGVPDALALRVAVCEAVVAALPVTVLAGLHDEDPLAVGRLHFVLAERLGLDWLRERIGELPRADRWQTEARAALRDDFYESQRALTDAALSATPSESSPEARADQWISAHEAEVARYRRVVDDIEAAGELDLATLAVARRALRELTAP
jgi:glutamate dehydrogenase